MIKMKSVTPVDTSLSTICDKIGFAATGTSAFGCVWVCGLSLLPIPATGIIAFITLN